MNTPSYAFKPVVDIGGRAVGRGHPAMVVAEIGPNHNGSTDGARHLIDLAGETGCDAVKFQYHLADAEIFDRTTRSYYYDESRYDFIKRVQEFPHEIHRELREYTAAKGMAYLCSVFSEDTVDRVVDLDPDAFKVPSGEVGNPWLMERVGASGKPIVSSSGMSPQGEIDAMMSILSDHSDDVVLLHCLSEYPTALDNMNLNMIPALAERYGCPVGLSDHSRHFAQVAASVICGAAMIEVHFTLDRTASGPDHHVSLTPEEMANLVSMVRDHEQALGGREKVLGENVASMRSSFTNSIVARRDIAAGEMLSRDNLALKKPGTGLSPEHLGDVLGRRIKRALGADEPLQIEDVE